MSDGLRRMFELQERFCREYWAGAGIDVSTPEGRASVLRENALGAHNEVGEALRTQDRWKPHRGVRPRFRPAEGLAHELADVLKYTLGIAVAHGIGPEELLLAFEEKSALVEARYAEETALSRLAHLRQPVAVLRAEGLLYDPDAAADDACGGPGRAALLTPSISEALLMKLSADGRLFSRPAEGFDAALRAVRRAGLRPVVASTAPAAVSTLPALSALVAERGSADAAVFGRPPVYLGPPYELARELNVLAYLDADPAGANAAAREGVRVSVCVGGGDVSLRACGPGVTHAEDLSSALEHLRRSFSDAV